MAVAGWVGVRGVCARLGPWGRGWGLNTPRPQNAGYALLIEGSVTNTTGGRLLGA